MTFDFTPDLLSRGLMTAEGHDGLLRSSLPSTREAVGRGRGWGCLGKLAGR